MQSIRNLLAEGRILDAHQYYQKICQVRESWWIHLSFITLTPSPQNLTDDDLAEVEQIAEKVAEVQKALTTNQGVEWTHGVSRDGITSTYNPEPDGSYSVCLHGTQENIPLFEYCATMLDLDRYSSWFPLCNLSRLIHAPGTPPLNFASTVTAPHLYI